MVFWSILFVLMVIVFYCYCRASKIYDAWQTVYIGRLALLIACAFAGASLLWRFFCYKIDTQKVNIEMIAKSAETKDSKSVIIAEVHGEKIAFVEPSSYCQQLKVGQQLTVFKKSSQNPIFWGWSDDWKIQK